MHKLIIKKKFHTFNSDEHSKKGFLKFLGLKFRNADLNSKMNIRNFKKNLSEFKYSSSEFKKVYD